MATHSSVIAWRIPGTGEPWRAALYGVTQSRTQLKRLSSSSSSSMYSVMSSSNSESFTNSFPILVQFSHSVMSDSLRPHGLQPARPPCPSSTPGVYSNSSPLSLGCHPTISSSVIPFSFCPQSFPVSGSFQLSQVFTSVAKVLEFQLQHQSFQ